MAIENASSQPVIVRFGVPMQQASWGYVVGPGQSGVGWTSRSGAILEPIRIFRTDCNLMVSALPTGVSSIRIDDESIETVDPVEADQLLEYNGQCAFAMPPLGTGVE
jgi:hypothetical protein